MTLWHDNTEVPTDRSNCFIIRVEGKTLEDVYFELKGNNFFHNQDCAYEIINLSEVKKWAYEEDLIKSAFKEPLLYMIRDKKTNELYESPVYSDAPTVFTDYRGADLESDILNQEDEDTEVVALYD